MNISAHSKNLEIHSAKRKLCSDMSVKVLGDTAKVKIMNNVGHARMTELE